MDTIKNEAQLFINDTLCFTIDEMMGDIPYITKLMCKRDEKINAEEENIFLQKYILENTGMVETNNKIKVQMNDNLGHTTIPKKVEESKVEPIFLVTGMGICGIILCLMIIGIIVFLIYMIYFTENGKEFVRSMRFKSEFGFKHPDSILKQYEFPIPPPPPPPPVNFVMDPAFK